MIIIPDDHEPPIDAGHRSEQTSGTPQGTGKRLFADSGPAIKLALAGSETYSSGALHLTYTPAA